eukprot:gene6603-10102_t
MSHVKESDLIGGLQMQRSGIDLYKDRSATVKKFLDAKRHFELKSYKGCTVKTPMSFGLNTKPESAAQLSALTSLRPLTRHDLTLQSTHRGAYLPGRIVEADAFFTGSSCVFLLEDLQGQVLPTAVYNVPRAEEVCSSLFHEGRLIAVHEPFFKQGADGQFVIRIEDPKEVINYPDEHHFAECSRAADDAKRHLATNKPLPRNMRSNLVIGDAREYSLSWKGLGNAFFKQLSADPRSLQKAVLCYNRALLISYPDRGTTSIYVDFDDVCAGCPGGIFALEPKKRPIDIEEFSFMTRGVLSELNAASGIAPSFAGIPDASSLGETGDKAVLNENTVRMLAVLYSNAAICCLQLERLPEAVRYAAVSCTLNPHNVKANHRLVQALAKHPSTRSLALWIAEYQARKWRTVLGASSAEVASFNDIIKETKPHSENATTAARQPTKEQTLLWAVACDEVWKPGGDDLMQMLRAGHSTDTIMTWVSEKEEGRKAFAGGEYTEALRHFLRAITLVSGHGQVLAELGVVLNNRSAAFLQTAHGGAVAERSVPDGPPMGQILGDFVSAEDLRTAFRNKALSPVEKLLLMRAASDACVATMLNPHTSKSWIRFSRALRKLGLEACCTKLVQAALAYFEDEACMNVGKPVAETRESIAAALQNELNELIKPVKTIPQISTTTTEEQGKQLECARGDKNESGEPQASELLSLKLRSKPEVVTQILSPAFLPLVQRFPESLHISFPKTCGFPGGVDTTLASKCLYEAYSSCSSEPWISCMVMEGELAKGDYREYEVGGLSELDGRFIHASEAVTYLHSKLRQLSDVPREWRSIGVLDYKSLPENADYFKSAKSPQSRAAFVNVTVLNHRLTPGNTHVAVGFNDLGCMTALCTETLKKEAESQGAVDFKGVDLNEFSIAKYLVIVEMLKLAGDTPSTNVTVSHVLQVWYSSTWTAATLTAFRLGVKHALKVYRDQTKLTANEKKAFPINKAVMIYLRLWIDAEPPSLAEARRLWMTRLERAATQRLTYAFGLERKVDRMAAVHYAFTGDVFASFAEGRDEALKPRSQSPEKPATGSVCMFRYPEGAGPESDDNFLRTVSDEQMIAEYERDIKRRKAPTDIFGLAVAIRLQLATLRLQHLKFWNWLVCEAADQSGNVDTTVAMYEQYSGSGKFEAVESDLRHMLVRNLDTRGGRVPEVLIRMSDVVKADFDVA